MIRVNVHLAVASLRGAKIRSLLTMVAVIIGVASFVIVTSTIDGLSQAAETQIDSLGGNLVTINPGKLVTEDEDGEQSFNFAASFGTSTLTEKDLNSVSKIDGINAIAPQILISGQVERGEDELTGALIIATNEDYPDAFGQVVEKGTFLPDGSSEQNFVVVGSNVVEKLYSGELSLGTKISIRGKPFTVIGSMAEYTDGLNFGGIDLNNAVLISLKSSELLTGAAPLIQEIDIQLNDDADPDTVVAAIESTLLENHGGQDDFTVLKQDDLIELTDSIFGLIKSSGQFLSYIMLFVASIVILLIMLITVRERTREIGIRKSIGATNSNILIQFLTEAIVLSWVGSFIGLIAGYFLGFLLERVTDITPVYSLNTILTVVAISTVVGVIAGVIPAWMAARKDPVESLRHE